MSVPIRDDYSRAQAVTPNDIGVQTFDAVWVGTGGNLAIFPREGSTASVILQNVPSGTLLKVRVRGILATGTTAAALIGLQH